MIGSLGLKRFAVVAAVAAAATQANVASARSGAELERPRDSEPSIERERHVWVNPDGQRDVLCHVSSDALVLTSTLHSDISLYAMRFDARALFGIQSRLLPAIRVLLNGTGAGSARFAATPNTGPTSLCAKAEQRVKDARLARVLAQLYPREADQRTVVEASGLDQTEIEFDAKAVNAWTFIVRHARLHGLVERIVDTALEDFPNYDDLQKAAQDAIGV